MYYYKLGHGEIRTHDLLSNRFQDDRVKPLHHMSLIIYLFI